MSCDMLSEVDHGKETWKVKVRVIRLWDAINPNSKELISLDMILRDAQGTMIHATIKKFQVNKFRPLIKEGSIYVITNFKVSMAADFRPIENDKILNFLHSTKVQEIQDPEFIATIEQSFNFATIEVLSDQNGSRKYLSDVIGLASCIGHIEETQTCYGISKIRDIFLRIEDERVKVRLWGEKVNLISEESTGCVVIVTSTTVKKMKEYSLSSTSATKIYVDLEIPQTTEIHKSYSSQENIIEERMFEGHLKGTIEEQMLYNRRTLQEIIEITSESDNQEKFYTAKATITSVNTTDEWYYIGCDVCNKKVVKTDNNLYCSKCEKEPKKTSPRYKLKLEIGDSTTTMGCTMFDSEAKKLIQQPASSLIDSEYGDINDKTNVIQKICGKTLIFQFRLDDYNLKFGYPDYTIHRIFLLNYKETPKRSEVKQGTLKELSETMLTEENQNDDASLSVNGSLLKTIKKEPISEDDEVSTQGGLEEDMAISDEVTKKNVSQEELIALLYPVMMTATTIKEQNRLQKHVDTEEDFWSMLMMME
ncbi:unnamed protein product [Urochloa decumbens]|uniref:Replication factor A C-terminal domain-containing protein n=1 Tax=Urochloa decumbens TaxID=240449 RepID=A0ABC9DFC1_9POAL